MALELKQMGFERVYALEGGWLAWKGAFCPSYCARAPASAPAGVGPRTIAN